MVTPTTERFSSIARIALGAASIFVFIMTASVQVGAQQRHVSRDPVEVGKHFQSAIDALAAKWHIAIVAESTPIMESAGVDLSASLATESVDQAVERVASAFDYSMKRTGNVFILNKLFTDPEDLPDVTLKEANAALSDMLQILPAVEARYMPRLGGRLIGTMVSMLTHDQRVALDHGGVPISTMTVNQRGETWRVAEALKYSQVIDNIKESAYFIQGALTRDPVSHWENAGVDYREFGYDADVVTRPTVRDLAGNIVGQPQHLTMLKPLSHPDVRLWSDGVTERGTTVNEAGEIVSDPTAPEYLKPEQIKKMAAENEVSTLASVIKRINKRTNEAARCAADKELLDKAVTLVGEDNALPADIMSACANLYGLQARHRTGGGITIARRTDAHVNGPSEVNSALLTVIPDSVIRCAKARLTRLRVGADAAQIKAHPVQYGQFEVGRHISAVARRQVRAIAEPLALAAADKSVALSKLPAGLRTVFAVSQSVEAFFFAMDMCDRGSPGVLLDFDNAVLQGSFVVGPNQTRITIEICAADPNTGLPISAPGFTTSSIIITGGPIYPPQAIQGQ